MESTYNFQDSTYYKPYSVTFNSTFTSNFEDSSNLIQKNVNLSLLKDDLASDFDDPEQLFNSFQKLTFSSPSGPLTPPLSLVSNYLKLCQQWTKQLNSSLNQSHLPPQRKKEVEKTSKVLENEGWTWSLLEALLSQRLNPEPLSSPTLKVQESEKRLVEELFSSNSQLREAQLIIDWLEDICRGDLEQKRLNFLLHPHNSAPWENTHQSLKSNKVSQGNKLIVTQLDPDSVSREKRNLHKTDQEDMEKLLQFLFFCLRSGMFDQACLACHRVNQPWRAATLQGWKLFHDGNKEGPGVGGGSSLEGNVQRKLWRRCVRKLAREENISLVEKAIYGSLCGLLQPLLNVSHTWHDFLWAHMKCYVDRQVENYLSLHANHDPSSPLYYDNQEMEEEEGGFFIGSKENEDKIRNIENIIQSVESFAAEEVKRQSQHRYNIIQKFIILDQLDVLLEYMRSWCEDKDHPPHPHLLRFMAHFVLFFQGLQIFTQSENEIVILSTFIYFLIGENVSMRTLIAPYLSSLPSSLQISLYSTMLLELKETNERKKFLNLARNYQLPEKEIAEEVVKKNLKKVEACGPPLDQVLPQPISQEDTEAINSLEWLMFQSTWKPELIFYSNLLFRRFICKGKLEACQTLRKFIPAPSPSDMAEWREGQWSNVAKEWKSIILYLNAEDSFANWFNHLKKKPQKLEDGDIGSRFKPHLDSFKREQALKTFQQDLSLWQQGLEKLAQNCSTQIKEVLLFEDATWMKDDIETGDEERKEEMEGLRSLCIPSLSSLLRVLLLEMGWNSQISDLVSLIMDEKHKIYTLFSQERMKGFVDEFAYSCVQSLSNHKEWF